MSTIPLPRLRQRADYTHKHNLKTGRHGWLRLTPAYSVKIVEDLMVECEKPTQILDPFCGTATTALSAAYHGHASATTDINPFLVWLGRAKTAYYSADDISATRKACACAIALLKSGSATQAACPPIHDIERWWSPEALRFLCSLKGAIEHISEADSSQRTLLHVAFCRSLIALSNASFNHQSMSFKSDQQMLLPSSVDMAAIFNSDVDFILAGASDNPYGTAEVILADSRALPERIGGLFDRVITSPPYVNRMSYIRELRPYMYWLGWLRSGRQAGELDWTAIGGTWGVATSRLLDWRPLSTSFQEERLNAAVERIAHAEHKNGALLANYVSKYFDDMWLHFQSLLPLLASGAQLHYIVGNSTFYGVLLPVEEFYADMLRRLGFQNVQCRPIRKRNSKKELIEFDVTATWR